MQSGSGPTFATTTDDGRIAALEAMVKDPEPAIQQVANQVLPFASFSYWSDAAMDEPASPGGRRLPHWDLAGFSGPSHGRLDSYLDGLPPDFEASWDPDGWHPRDGLNRHLDMAWPGTGQGRHPARAWTGPRR